MDDTRPGQEIIQETIEVRYLIARHIIYNDVVVGGQWVPYLLVRLYLRMQMK